MDVCTVPVHAFEPSDAASAPVALASPADASRGAAVELDAPELAPAEDEGDDEL